jgi:putative MATE family efflux protein
MSRFGEEPVLSLILRYSMPAIAGMVVYGLNRIVGNIFVGTYLGHDAMAGFTVAYSIVMVMLSFIMLVGSGSSVLISMSLGKKDPETAGRVLGTALVVGLGAAIVLAACGWLFTEPLLRAFGGDGQSLAYASSFIRVYLAGTIFQFWSTTLNSAIRAEGFPGIALITNVVSFIANVVLTVILLFVIPLGITGVALANVLSQCLVTVWLAAHFFGKKTVLRITASTLKPSGQLARRFLSIGLAPFFMQFLGALIGLATNNLVRSLAGDLGLAVSGAVFSVYFLLAMPLMGTSNGLQPIIGYNHGAGLHDRVRKAVIVSLVFTASICVLEEFLAIVFRSDIASLFAAGDASMRALCADGLLCMLAIFPVASVQFIASSYFLGTGQPKQALAVNLFRSIFVLVPMFVLSSMFGLSGAFASWPVTDFLVAILCVALMRGAIRRAGKSRNEAESSDIDILIDPAQAALRESEPTCVSGAAK